MIAVSEALSIGEKLGGDPVMLSDIYSVSTGRCYAVDTYSPVPGYKEASPASALNYMGGFMTKLIKKDMGLAVQAAKDGGAHCHETQRAFEMYSKMDDMGLGDHDFSYVYQFFKADFKDPRA
jgi:3-hydroxyisobutyrate dehydrogenase